MVLFEIAFWPMLFQKDVYLPQVSSGRGLVHVLQANGLNHTSPGQRPGNALGL